MNRFFVGCATLAVLIALLGAGTSQAAIVTSMEQGTAQQLTDDVAFSVGGGQMGGLKITVNFSGGNVQTAFWVDTEPDKKGGIFGRSDFEMFADVEPVDVPNKSGDGTFGDEDEWGDLDDNDISSPNEVWEFKLLDDSLVVESIILERGNSDVVFDTALGSINQQLAGDVFGTTGSRRGRNFYSDEFAAGPDGNDLLDVDVLFSNQIVSSTVGSAIVANELYTNVTIDFMVDGQAGYDKDIGSSFNFGLDTDLATGLQDFNPVPEPASLLVWSLLGGLGVSGWWRRRA